MMRAAAASRSQWASGRPCVTLASTAITNAAAESPSKKRTGTCCSPRRMAARNRCMPSMTRIDGRWTTIGGSGWSTSARSWTWESSSPDRRGESDAWSAETATCSTALRSRSVGAGTSSLVVRADGNAIGFSPRSSGAGG